MPTYLKRYKNGEYEQVWAELVALGGDIRLEPLYSDALAVAHETISRVNTNINTLKERLINIGYKFAPPEALFEIPKARLIEKVTKLEQLAGPIPLSLRVFYEVIGQIGFYGIHPSFGVNLAGYEDQDGSWLETLSTEYYDFYYNAEAGKLSDPLAIEFPYKEVVLEYYVYDFLEPGKYYIPIAPDIYHKADTSGAGSTLIGFPNQNIDGILHGDWEGRYFVEYLREAFRWGGFPGLKKYPSHDKETLAFLTEGLLPI